MGEEECAVCIGAPALPPQPAAPTDLPRLCHCALLLLLPADAGPLYNPKEAYDAYRSLFKGQILMGVEVPPEAWVRMDCWWSQAGWSAVSHPWVVAFGS